MTFGDFLQFAQTNRLTPDEALDAVVRAAFHRGARLGADVYAKGRRLYFANASDAQIEVLYDALEAPGDLLELVSPMNKEVMNA